MRGLKFRVYDTELGDYAPIECVFGFTVDHDSNIITLGNKEGHNEIIVEQFTGLKDKNGVDIYEGDIVKCSWEGAEGFIATHKGEVTYDEMNCHFYSYSLKQEFSRSLSCNINESVVVIGNIHEAKR